MLWVIGLALLQFRQPAGGNLPVESGIGVFNVIMWMVEVAIIVLTFAGMWAAFAKAGQPGWAAIIPIYNMIVLAEIADKPVWWGIVAACVPCVGVVFFLLMCLAVAEKFGQGAGYGIGLWLLGFIFWPMLGFGSAQFEGGRRKRRRPRDDDDEDDDDRPSRRRARDDDDDDDRPRKKPRARDDDDDDDDDRRVKRRPRDDD